jgi:hypothetical protein
MTTTAEPASEWTAAPMRPTATWVPVTRPDGRTRMEMVWSVPALDVPDLTRPAVGGSSAA